MANTRLHDQKSARSGAFLIGRLLHYRVKKQAKSTPDRNRTCDFLASWLILGALTQMQCLLAAMAVWYPL